MIGNSALHSSTQEGAFLSPLQQLRSQSMRMQPPSPKSFHKSRQDVTVDTQSNENSHESSRPSYDTKGSVSQHYTALVANQIHLLRKISHYLMASNEVMDEFVSSPNGLATQLRSLLMPHFTDIELLLTTNLNELLKAQKELAQSSTFPSSTSSSCTSSVLPLGRQMLNEALALPSEPSIMTPVFPPKQLAKLDNAFNYLREQFKEPPINSYPDTSPLPFSIDVPANPDNPLSKAAPTLCDSNNLFDFPGFQALGSTSNSFRETNRDQEMHTSAMMNSFGTKIFEEHSNPPSSFFNSSSDLLRKLRFDSEPSLTASPRLGLNPAQNEHAPPHTDSSSSLFPSTFPAFPMDSLSAPPKQVEEPSPKLQDSVSSSLRILGFNLHSKEESTPSEPTTSSMKPYFEYADHLELLQKDLLCYLSTEREILQMQGNDWIKEVTESMEYHALAVARQKWDQSSNQKFDLKTLHQDLKVYAKRHKVASEYSLNILAFTICSHLKKAEYLDKSVISVCNTIMMIDRLPIRAFTILYMLIPELRELSGLYQCQFDLPPYLKNELEKHSNPLNLPIFFAALSINQAIATPNKYFSFYLNPVFKAAEFQLSKKPAKDSESLQFVMTIVDMASYYLFSRDLKRMDSILEVLQQHYDVDDDEFGYNDPEKFWPFFLIKDEWEVTKVVGHYVQYGSESSIRKLHQDALGFVLDPAFTVDKKMEFKIKPMMSDIRAEAKWVKKTCRVVKQAFAMFQKEKERAFLASIISVWLMRPEPQVVNLGKLSQAQLNYLCQFLLHIFSIYRIFKVALFYTLFSSCKLLVAGEFVTNDFHPDDVVAYGRFWATLAITIPWFGEANSYFVSPIFMLLENMPTHPRSELLASTILDVSEQVLRRYRPESLNELLSTLCSKYPMLHAKYKGPPPTLTSIPPPTPSSSSSTSRAEFATLQSDIQNLTLENAELLSKNVLESLTSNKSPSESRDFMETLILTILDRIEVVQPLERDAMALANFSFSLIVKNSKFYASFLTKLLERCPLLNTRLPTALVENPELYLKYLRLIPLFVILHNNALITGSTVLNAIDLLPWYEHLVRSGTNNQTADILAIAIHLSPNFFSNERFLTFLTYLHDKVIPSLPETLGKNRLMEVLDFIFNRLNQSKQ